MEMSQSDGVFVGDLVDVNPTKSFRKRRLDDLNEIYIQYFPENVLSL